MAKPQINGRVPQFMRDEYDELQIELRRVVQRSWPGTASWMLSCSAHEGGHGRFVMNTQGSGAGGWLQYMESTFNYHYSAALQLARREHKPLPAGLGWVGLTRSPKLSRAGGAWSDGRPLLLSDNRLSV